jgi:hypothetical protein
VGVRISSAALRGKRIAVYLFFIAMFVKIMGMKNKYLAILAALMMPVLMSFAPGWVTFESRDQAFSAMFPGKVDESEQSVKTDVGELALKIFAYEPAESLQDDNMVYMVMTTTYPASSNISSDATADLPTMFRNAVDGGVKNVSGKLLAEKDIKIAGYPGREYKISYQDGDNIIKGKMYLVKQRMYMIQGIYSKEKDGNATLQKFLDSFRLM